MLNSVLKRYPELTEEDVTLRDDGTGVYIEKWNSPEPKPTAFELKTWAEEDAKLPKPLTEKERIAELENVVNMLLLGGI